MDESTVKRLMRLTGAKNDSRLAKFLGISPQRLHQLKSGGTVTFEMAMKVERATNGLVQRHHLLPDLFEGYVPLCRDHWDSLQS